MNTDRKILAVDNDENALYNLRQEIKDIYPSAKIAAFCEVTQVLTYLNEQEHRKLDYAFLDTCLCGLPGIELARVIREYNPKTKITEGSLKPLTYHPNQSNITLSKAIPIYLFSSYPHSRAVIPPAPHLILKIPAAAPKRRCLKVLVTP